jgi:hypothetical protein
MAKRPPRSQADDVTTQTRPKPQRTRGPRELATAAVANREPDVVKFDDGGGAQPENISAALGTADREVQQAPGDAVAARAAFGTPAASEGGQPTAEDIRRRAYEMYLERGASHGSDFDDWLKAEQELRESRPRSSTSRS